MFVNSRRIILLVVVVLVAGLFWFFRADIFQYVNRPSSKPVLSFPAIENREVIKKDFENKSIAKELSQFILDGAENKIFWKLNYSGIDLSHNAGFGITYELISKDYNLNKFLDRQIHLIKTNNWKLLAYDVNGNMVFLETERQNPAANYKARITAEEKGVHSEVNIQYLMNYD